MLTLRLRRIAVLFATTIAVSGCMLVLPGLAAAAETYANTAYSGCESGNWGSGSSDESGNLFAACNGTIIRYDTNGVRLPNIVLPQTTTDVAPSPDGAFLYVFQNDTVVRYDRQPDKTYVKDATWKIASYVLDGTVWPVRGRYIAVDAWGDLYISSGGWYDFQEDAVAKFHADGTFMTAFGGWGNGVGQFNVNMGLAVSRDGRTIYVDEQTNGRIQRFDYNNGHYDFTLTFGSTDVSCVGGSTLSAPYDVGLDPWGFVYVLDASCQRVKKFTGNGGYLGIVATHPTAIAHGIAVGHHGEFYVGQWGQLFTRTAANPEPGAIPAIAPLPVATPPDIAAPILSATTLPATTPSQTITIGVSASDNVGVTSMRFANEDGNWGPWVGFATTAQQTLTAGYGFKGVTTQVRDAAGNQSNTIFHTLSYLAGAPVIPPVAPAPDAQAPVLIATTVPASTTTQTIAVGITATDNTAVTQVRFANEDNIWGAFTAYAPTVSTTLSAGFGVKTVNVQVKDAAGNLSNTISKTLSYQPAIAPPPPPAPVDIADPVLNSATMPTVTNNRTITVATDATDDTAVTVIRFANEDGIWGPWQPYAVNRDTTLTAGFGAKIVFVQVGDAFAHVSAVRQLNTSYQADVALPPVAGIADVIAPMLTDAAVPSTSTTQAITISLAATDDVAVAQVRFANEDGNWTGWQTYAPNMAWTLSPGYTLKLVFIQVRDAARNESTILQRKTQLVLNQPPVGPLDAADPVLTSVTVPNPALTRTISIGLVATDDIGVSQVRFANEDGNWTPWQPYAATMSWALSPGNLFKLVFTQVRDASGKESNVAMSKTLLNAPNNGA